MAASSLTFAAVNPPRAHVATVAIPGAISQPASIHVPLRFMITGVLALLTGVAALAYRPEMLSTYHYNQHVIAVTHLFVLGWILTIVMGAMYQLVPVALETRLYSERLARWQFLLHVSGFGGMVWMFWTWNMKHVGHFGALLATGVCLFIYNIGRTLLRVPKWNVIASGVSCALAWMSLTILAGLTVAAGKCSYEETTSATGPALRFLSSIPAFTARFDAIGAMHAHAHLGVLGVFVMLIVGVSYKLVPMFTLSEIRSRRRAMASLILLNGGLAGSFFAILLRSRWKPLLALVVVAGLVVYGIEIIAILRSRKRRALDWGMVYFLTGIALLVPVGFLGLILSLPSLQLTALTGQIENLYGFLALTGVVSLAIVGMLYKIIPFLVWYGRYSRLIGLQKVPALADLYSARLQAAGYWSYLAGLAGTSAGILLSNQTAARSGAALLLASIVLLGINIAKMLAHLGAPGAGPVESPALSTTRI